MYIPIKFNCICVNEFNCIVNERLKEWTAINLCMNVSSIFINQNMAVNGKRPEAVQGRLDGQLVIAEGADDSLLKV